MKQVCLLMWFKESMSLIFRSTMKNPDCKKKEQK